MTGLARALNDWQNTTARIPGGHHTVTVDVEITARDGSTPLRTNLSNKQEARLVALLHADIKDCR